MGCFSFQALGVGGPAVNNRCRRTTGERDGRRRRERTTRVVGRAGAKKGVGGVPPVSGELISARQFRHDFGE